MNSDKKMYEQLLKYHPEFKDSKEDVKKAIHNLQEINPDIKVNQVFADKLKQKLTTIAQMKSEEKKSSFNFLWFIVPVFTFGFAVFWFWYLSDDLISPDDNFQQEIGPVGWAAPAMLRMDIQEEWQNTRMMMKYQDEENSNNSIDELADSQPETTIFNDMFVEEISDDFSLWCEDNEWEISTLNDQTRVCNLEKTTCLEDDFYEWNCISQDK